MPRLSTLRLTSLTLSVSDIEPAMLDPLLQLYIPGAALVFCFYFCAVGAMRYRQMGPTILVAVPVSA